MLAEVVIPCRDLDAVSSALVGHGFAIDFVMPADDPATISLSGHGARVRLVRDLDAAPATIRIERDDLLDREVVANVVLELAPPEPLVVPEPHARTHVTRAATTTWHTGRAGMSYRDLVADRCGGWLVASHIRIADAGPVADYVHFHELRAQVIYCRAGWVRLVYEDQGEPFVMRAGDCVVQPPRIRHRVLESSAGLEVIELASPAAHATRADRGMELPNGSREREWDGQRFVWHRAEQAIVEHAAPGWQRRDLGLGVARGEVWSGRGMRRETTAAITFGFVLAGSATLDGEPLGPDDSFVLAPGEDHELALDGELLALAM